MKRVYRNALHPRHSAGRGSGDRFVAQIAYTLHEDSDVKLSIYTISGRLVATLDEGMQPAGTRTLDWSAGPAARGLYFVQLRTADKSVVERMILLTP